MSVHSLSRRRLLTVGVVVPVAANAASSFSRPLARTLRVGPGGDVHSLREAAKLARDGDTIEIVAGEYFGEVAVWNQSELTIRGHGGMARLEAAGASAEGKGIFVVRAGLVRVENITFAGAKVPDGNGAGIRLERGRLEVHHCRFEGNENGILTGNDARTELAVTNSGFLGNGNDRGSGHTIYAGAIERVGIMGCYLGRGRIGHLLKSRAKTTSITYCRLTGEDGTASYELELPNGGRALVVGNLIQQGPRSPNATVISFGAEGYRWPESDLTLAFNTIINDRRKGGVFVRVAKGAPHVALAANLLVGPGSMAIDAPLQARGNFEATRDQFADSGQFDYRLRAHSKLVGQAGIRGASDAATLPEREYVHEASTYALARTSALTPLSPGAFQRVAP